MGRNRRPKRVPNTQMLQFKDKYGNITDGIVIDTNYQCDFDERLNGCVKLKVWHDNFGLGWVNTLISKSQILSI